MITKAVCPEHGTDTTFFVNAVVVETWEVTPSGDFIREIVGDEGVVTWPNPNDIWTCAKCGKQAAFDAKS
jgi:hypothetical protein